MHHAIHTLGLTDLLRSGVMSGADEEYVWNIIDNTYIDDVSAQNLHRSDCANETPFRLPLR